MNPDALRDAVIAAVACALLFAAVRDVRRRLTPGYHSTEFLPDVATVAIVVFLVVASMPMWQLGDEVLPPPFTAS